MALIGPREKECIISQNQTSESFDSMLKELINRLHEKENKHFIAMDNEFIKYYSIVKRNIDMSDIKPKWMTDDTKQRFINQICLM